MAVLPDSSDVCYQQDMQEKKASASALSRSRTAVMLAPQTRFRLITLKPELNQSVRLSCSEWQTICCIAQTLCLSEIAQSLDRSCFDVNTIVMRLLQQGLIEVIVAPESDALTQIAQTCGLRSRFTPVPSQGVIAAPWPSRPLKLVVTGAYGSGKSQFVRSASTDIVLDTDVPVSDPCDRMVKDVTTVAFDFGSVTLQHGAALHLYGTPGQPRFDLLWDALALDCDAYLVLVDSTRPVSLVDTIHLLQCFARLTPAPFLVVANKQDQPAALTPAEIQRRLHQVYTGPVIPCVATDACTTHLVLHALLQSVNRLAFRQAPVYIQEEFRAA